MAPAAATRSGAPRGGGLPFLSFPGAGSSPLRARPPPPPAEPEAAGGAPGGPSALARSGCPLCARATPLLHSWAGGAGGGDRGSMGVPEAPELAGRRHPPLFRALERGEKERKRGPPGPGSTRKSTTTQIKNEASRLLGRPDGERAEAPWAARGGGRRVDGGRAAPRRALPSAPPPGGPPAGTWPASAQGRQVAATAGRAGRRARPPPRRGHGGATAGRSTGSLAERAPRTAGPRGRRPGRRPGPSRSARPGAAWEETGGGRGGGVGGGRGRRKGGQA